MSIKKVNQKLYKSKKVDLKTRKVSLNKLQELKEQAGISGLNYQFAVEQVEIAHEHLMTAWDIIRFEEPKADAVQDELDEITSGLDDLGIEYPAEVQDVQSDLDYAKERFNQVLVDMEWWGIEHDQDRM